MKSITLTSIVAASMVLGTAVPVAFASKTSSTVGGRKAIAVNGKVVSQPYTRVAVDSGNQTSYIGVWYLGQAAKSAGGNYTWDPTNKVFNLTIPGVDTSKIRVAGGIGSGDTTIQVNGTTVKKFHSFAAQDPAGGVNDITTFVPLYYIGNVFNAIGSGSSWNGTTFAFKTFVQATTPTDSTTAPTTPAEKTYGDGTYVVGTDIQPGLYYTAGDVSYWERVKDFSGSMDAIIANDIPSGQDYVQIEPTDKGFTTQGTGTWVQVDPTTVKHNILTTFSDGTYLVGVDIEPGTYKVTGGDGGYWARLNGVDGGMNDIIANDKLDSGSGIVTIQPGDFAFQTSGGLVWTKVD